MSSVSVLAAACLCWIALSSLAHSTDVPTSSADASSGANETNSANNPLTPKITVNLQDYFLPDLNRTGGQVGEPVPPAWADSLGCVRHPAAYPLHAAGRDQS
ncbi:MAG TPA: hypothetical protein VLJ20_03900, partial [Acetobacteraceae bacterium]|nr:hypothetical protein [Acetobacteraceae bacterium]